VNEVGVVRHEQALGEYEETLDRQYPLHKFDMERPFDSDSGSNSGSILERDDEFVSVAGFCCLRIDRQASNKRQFPSPIFLKLTVLYRLTSQSPFSNLKYIKCRVV